MAFDARHFLLAFALAFSCGRSISSRRGDGVWGMRELADGGVCSSVRSGDADAGWHVLCAAEAMRAMTIDGVRVQRAVPRLSTSS